MPVHVLPRKRGSGVVGLRLTFSLLTKPLSHQRKKEYERAYSDFRTLKISNPSLPASKRQQSSSRSRQCLVQICELRHIPGLGSLMHLGTNDCRPDQGSMLPVFRHNLGRVRKPGNPEGYVASSSTNLAGANPKSAACNHKPLMKTYIQDANQELRKSKLVAHEGRGVLSGTLWPLIVEAGF